MNTLPLENKKLLITGGSRGIGKACALKLASNGCDVAIGYFNSSDEADEVVAEIHAMGRKAFSVQVNVSDRKSIAEMVEVYKSHFDSLDIFISNAASGVLKPNLEMNVKHWRWCMETNALALNEITKQVHSLFNAGGRVIALSSLGASRAIPNYGFIGASKAALEALVRSLSIELAADDITVNTISAGVIDTDALKHFPNREQILDDYHQHSLAKSPLSVEDVADTAYLLCLPEAKMIRGQTLFVDAGYSIVG